MCETVPRNYDTALHPLEAPREYVRALNSVKLERVFAKPFLGSLDGHKDGISCLGKHPHHLSIMLSGACDGEVNMQICVCCATEAYDVTAVSAIKAKCFPALALIL